ncbi:ABC transporter permease [Alkaliphilus serpentinus]|uniref:ABC transporter permease n=1 Tax=Alkaliphilus serpentinus TaxID=1482731 RepID=A0A833M9N8_9FIRM|nr:ABC transporter permease [Alkaliphilus serpentinus]KAB3530341.1 ABC transporter permease [Alkaliphilus serpentinus]
MRNIIFTVYYTILRYFRDKKTLVTMIVFPLVLIFILGSALSTAFTPSEMGKTKVAYLSLDKGGFTQAFEEFLQVEDVEELLEVVEIESYEEGVSLISQQKVSGFIFIEEDHSLRLQEGKEAKVKIVSSRYGNFRSKVIANVVEAFTNGSNAIAATATLGKMNPNYNPGNSIDYSTISIKGRIPTSMDYYSVTMLAMIMMYGSSYGIYGIAQDYFDSIGSRIKASPIRAYQLYIGKTLGIVLTLTLQALIVVLFSKYAYGVNWGGSIGVIMLICFSLATLSTGLGVMLSMVTGDRRAANNISSILVPVFTFISGGYMPLSNFGGGKIAGLFDRLKLVSPNYLTQRAMFNQIFDGSLKGAEVFIMGLWAISLMLFLTSIMAGRRQVQ